MFGGDLRDLNLLLLFDLLLNQYYLIAHLHHLHDKENGVKKELFMWPTSQQSNKTGGFFENFENL